MASREQGPGPGGIWPRGIWPRDTWACLSLAIIVAAILLIAGIDRAGIWDPYELDRAELARRIAIHRFGAEELRVAGAPNDLPTLGDLGAGELGFTSMALGFATLGLHEYAGRLPLALWGMVGALAMYAFLARTVRPRAGLHAVVALVTMPLYFMGARTMLGDIVSMASFALCFFGVAGALLERSSTHAVAFGVMGVLGAATGFLSRGMVLGVAAPLAGVALGWLALAGSRDGAAWRVGRPGAVGISACLLAYAAARIGKTVLLGVPPGEVRRLLGVAVAPSSPVEATFDLTVRDLGHALFPWSALLPFAFGLLLWRPGGVRAILLTGAAAAYAAHALLGPFAGGVAFVAPAVLAAIIGVVLDDLDDAPALPAMGVGVLVLAWVLLSDFLGLPEKALAAFGLGDVDAGIGEAGRGYLWAAVATFGLVWAATSLVASAPPSAPVRERLRARVREYEAAASELGRVWNGYLAFGFLLLEAALVGAAATVLIGRRLGWASIVGLRHGVAYAGLNLWWAIPVGLVLVPVVVDLARGALSVTLSALRLPRSAAVTVAGLGAGAMLCFGYYPAVAAQLSPKGALDAYEVMHRRGEPLGLLDVSARVGRYYSRGDDTVALASPRAAVEWLREQRSRRWLAFREEGLGELNSIHRELLGENLAIAESGAGLVLLGVSPRGDVQSVNPLDAFVGGIEPANIQHPVEASFGDQLDLLGWDVVDDTGAPASAVVPGANYVLRAHYRVTRRIGRNYEAFIHIDGAGRRYNGDHEVVGGVYPMTLWQPGDFIMDEHRFALERTLSPGRYAVYLGFFIHKERLAVTAGEHHDNRVIGGALTVR